MKIITNTAMSLDGKISRYADRHIFLGSLADRQLMLSIRKRVDAVLVGGQTFRNAPQASISPKKKIWNVIISHTMNFKLDRQYINHPGIRPLFLTDADRVPKNFPCPVLYSPQAIKPSWIVNQLAKKGVKTLLLEGGGKLIYQFLKAGLIDEMYVTLCPKIVGDTESPSIISGNGLAKIKNLKLISVKRNKDELFLHYRVP